jgi:HAD superfamily hydrolase (TIGR01509 family)
MITAVIFDLDGTLVDSNELHVRAWDRAFRHFGRIFTPEALRQQIGKGADQYMPAFLTPEEIKTFGKELEKYRSELFKEEYLPRVRPFPKVRELLSRVKEDGRKIALATSGKKQELLVYKRIAHIEDLIDCEMTADDADRSKPAPDLFASSLPKLGDLEAKNVIAVGDTPYDAEAAGKVGIKTVGLLCGGFNEAALRGGGVVEIYRDPGDLLQHYTTSALHSEFSSRESPLPNAAHSRR